MQKKDKTLILFNTIKIKIQREREREREREEKGRRNCNVTSGKTFLLFIASRIKVKSCHVCTPLGIC